MTTFDDVAMIVSMSVLALSFIACGIENMVKRRGKGKKNE